MGDVGRILNTARDAILANLTALNVTGSNIANVNTPGYSRLRPIFGAIGVFNAATDQTQVGVKVISIDRLYSKYLDAEMVRQEQYNAFSQSQLDILNRAEVVFNESAGGGINDQLSKFWGAWLQLSANPSSITERDNLVAASQSLASMFRQKATELMSIQRDTNTEISDAVTQLNGYLSQMADYNNKITQIEISGGSAADLRDKRTELLRNISQIVDVNYYEEATGQLNIYISNGRSLVEGENVWNLDVEVNPAISTNYDIVFADAPGVVINDELNGGKIAGLLDVRDTKVEGYLNDLSNMAATIVSTVNAQHASGYDLNGNIGGDFFSKLGVINAPVAASGNNYGPTVTAGGDYTGTTDKTYLMRITGAGGLGVATYQVSSDNGTTWGLAQLIPLDGIVTLGDGINLTFTAGAFAAGDSFSVKASVNARDMQVDPLIVGNVEKIAAAATVNSDGEIAGLIAAMKNDTSAMGSGVTFDNYYESLTSLVGQDVVDAKNNVDHQTSVINQVENQRQAISGVSLDEEMLNIIKYQAAYNAAGRLCAVVNAMMSTLINLGIETAQ